MKIYLVFKCGNRIALDRDEDFDLSRWIVTNNKILDDIGVDRIEWKKI
jgi:DNA-directed RNA polymerase subunit N (RpoN/RPB10)